MNVNALYPPAETNSPPPDIDQPYPNLEIIEPKHRAMPHSQEPYRPIESGSLGLLELILKAPVQLDRLIRAPSRQAELMPRFLGISLASFTFFGIAMSLVLSTSSVWPQLVPMEAVIAGREPTPLRYAASGQATLLAPWVNGNSLHLIAAYAIGLVAATGICLPSLYFYSLLAGVRMTMLDVVIQCLKSQAVGAVTLIGVLPIYATFGLAIAIFPMSESWRNILLTVGLILPFLAGSAGTYSLYRSLSGFADTIPAERRLDRECFLQRLVLSWATCYTAVAPVLIFTLWQRLQG